MWTRYTVRGVRIRMHGGRSHPKCCSVIESRQCHPPRAGCDAQWTKNQGSTITSQSEAATDDGNCNRKEENSLFPKWQFRVHCLRLWLFHFVSTSCLLLSPLTTWYGNIQQWSSMAYLEPSTRNFTSGHKRSTPRLQAPTPGRQLLRVHC